MMIGDNEGVCECPTGHKKFFDCFSSVGQSILQQAKQAIEYVISVG